MASDDDPGREPPTVTRETLLDSGADPPPDPSLKLRLQRDEVYQRLFGEPVSESIRIGRYLVEGTLGQGGMGTVLRAHDETLGRDVALKVLHDARGGRHAQRLLREAQALARLSHRNVVQVYDVDEIDGRLCMAMELVHGQSLDAWQLQPRPWSEVLEVYRQAGRGLAAAHAEGLVHRDFKPANCVIDPEGVVKVLDFGLARGVGAEPEELAAEAEATEHGREPSASDSVRASRSQRMLDQDLTRTGAMLGTLAYMAPEQLMGRAAAPTSDQFSFCVALYEALHGVRPFGGTTAMTILFSIQSAEPDGSTSRRGLPPVPKWLLEVLRQGLSVASHQRFESMDALLAAVERQLMRRRRRRRVAVGSAVLGGLGGALLVGALASREGPCEGLRQRPLPAWSADDRRAVRAAFEGSGLPGALEVHARAEAGLDAWAAAWTEARADACEDTWVRHESGTLALERRIACLDEHVPRVRATVDELASADARTAAHAVVAVAELPSLEPCSDAEALLHGPDPIPPALAEDATRVRELIARSWASGATGHHDGGIEAAERAVDAAAVLGDAPLLRLEALHNRGLLYHRAWRLTEAREDLSAALALAERLGDRARSIDVLHELILLADHDRDDAAAEAWMVAIRGKFDHFQDRPLRQAQRWALEARVALRAKRIDEALDASRRAVTRYEQLDPPAPEQHVDTLLLRGSVEWRTGDTEAAQRSYRRALEIVEHEDLLPVLGRVRYRLAYFDYVQGRFPEAEAQLRASLRGFEAYFGSQTVASARSRLLMALLLRMRGARTEALEQTAAAERSLGEGTPALLRGEIAQLRGALYRTFDRWDEAIASYRTARAAWQSMRLPSRVELAMLDSNIADCQVRQGRLRDAASLYDATLAVLEVETPPDDPRRAYPLVGRAQLALREGQPDRAVPLLRRALTLETALERDPTLAATARWALAQALRPSARVGAEQSAEAVQLAHQARAGFVAGNVSEAAEIDAWLERCGSPCATDVPHPPPSTEEKDQ